MGQRTLHASSTFHPYGVGLLPHAVLSRSPRRERRKYWMADGIVDLTERLEHL